MLSQSAVLIITENCMVSSKEANLKTVSPPTMYDAESI